MMLQRPLPCSRSSLLSRMRSGYPCCRQSWVTAQSGRQAIVIATVSGNVVYERFYDALTDLDKADLRASLQEATEPLLDKAVDELDYVSRYKSASVVFMKVNDLMLYLVGTGEYDELTLAETLRAIITALKEELPKLSEAGCFRDYGRLVLALDEMIYEGILHKTDKEQVRRGLAMEV